MQRSFKDIGSLPVRRRSALQIMYCADPFSFTWGGAWNTCVFAETRYSIDVGKLLREIPSPTTRRSHPCTRSAQAGCTEGVGMSTHHPNFVEVLPRLWRDALTCVTGLICGSANECDGRALCLSDRCYKVWYVSPGGGQLFSALILHL